MRKPSAPNTLAFSLLCATVMSAVVVPATAQPLAGAGICGASVNTPPSTMIDLEAIRCLINAERTSRTLPALTFNAQLGAAADGHAQRAVILKWWNPGSDSHVDPETGSTPTTRINGAGYCPAGAIVLRENTYTGWGSDSTPAAAVNWWMNISTAGHRDVILLPALREIGVGVKGDVANKDPAANAALDKGTYVVTFGACP